MALETQWLSESKLGKDANVLIMELNKGLQSNNLGIQCKTIAQFPSILEKNNYLRLCVLRSCNECRPHLEKLTICEDIVRKLLPFTASNDPTARALTLRLFGILNRITREHIGVHHAILTQIESHYEVESDAAVWSSHQLAPISSLCPILCKLLKSLSTESDIKLKLLRLAKHMYHNSAIAEQIRACLIDMLDVNRTSEFVMDILRTLTLLEIRAPLHASSQIDLLLNYLTQESRPQVCSSVLRDLSALAQHVPHHWNKSQIQKLCSIYWLPCCDSQNRQQILHTFYCLTNSYQALDLLTGPYDISDNVEAHTCLDCIQSALLTLPSSRLTIEALLLSCKLTILRANAGSQNGSNASESSMSTRLMPEHLLYSIVTQFNSSSYENSNKKEWYLFNPDISTEDLKKTWKILIEFFTAFPAFTSALHQMGLLKAIRLDAGIRCGLLCQFLSTIYSRLPHLISDNICNSSANPDYLNYSNVLNQIASSAASKPDSQSSVIDSGSVLSACGLVFQLVGGIFLTQSEQIRLLHSVARLLGEPIDSNAIGYRLSPWTAYQLARQANRYGQHYLAMRLYEKLTSLTFSERSHFWLQGLFELSQTEATLITSVRKLKPDLANPNDRVWIGQLISALRNAYTNACKSRTLFICVGNSDGQWFQSEYVAIRAKLYNLLSDLCLEAFHHSMLKRQPHPNTETNPIRVPIWLFNQLETWKLFREHISTIQIQCLDADTATHGHLEAICQLVTYFIKILQMIVKSYTSSNSITSDDLLISDTYDGMDQSVKCDAFLNVLPTLRTICLEHISNASPTSPLSLHFLPLLILKVVRISPQWPRFFFQRLQTTTVRLVLLPKAGNGPENVLNISSDIGHMVQVMGIVQQRNRSGRINMVRTINAVEIVLTVFECPSTGSCSSLDPDIEDGQLVFTAKRLASLQGDYFHCEFFVRFPQHVCNPQTANGLQHSADQMFRIQASPILLDDAGKRWNPGPSAGVSNETVFVRVESVANTIGPTISLVEISKPTETLRSRLSSKANPPSAGDVGQRSSMNQGSYPTKPKSALRSAES